MASVSYGHARQFSDVPSSGGGWGTNLAMGKNLYFERDAMFSFDLIGNLFYNKTKGLETDEITKPFVNEVLKSLITILFMNHKTSMLGLGIDGKLTFNKFRKIRTGMERCFLVETGDLYSKDGYGRCFGKILCY